MLGVYVYVANKYPLQLKNCWFLGNVGILSQDHEDNNANIFYKNLSYC